MTSILSSSLADLPLPVHLLFCLTTTLLLAWLGHWALIRCSPRWRVQLWRVVCLALPAATIGAVLPGFAILASHTQPPSETEPDDTVFVSNNLGRPLAGAFPADGPSTNTAGFFGSHREGFPVVAPSMAPDELPLFDPAIDWSFILETYWLTGIAVMWALGVLIPGLMWIRAQMRLHRLVAESQELPANCQQQIRAIYSDLSVPVRMTRSADVPFVAGIRRPVILLPQAMTEPALVEELPAILAHELSHVQSRDLLWMCILHWVTTFLWWHPLVWMMRAVHNMACEEVADAVAAGTIGDPHRYSQTLARVALATMKHPPSAVALTMARSPQIMSRLARLKLGFSSVPLSRRSIVLSALAGIIAGLLLAGIRVADARPAELPLSPVDSNTSGRTLNFPADRSVGRLSIATDYVSERLDRYQHRFDYRRSLDWQDFGDAQGQVTVPAGARVKLDLQADGARDTFWMKQLGASDLYALRIWPSANGPDFFPFGDDQARHIGHLTGLNRLLMCGVQVTARGMGYLEPLTSLKWLQLSSPQLGNAGLRSVGRLESLESLLLAGMKWDDRGLRHLSELRFLEEVSLPLPGQPGEGFDTVLALPRLRYLSAPTLNGSKLRRIKGSEKLTALDLGYCSELRDEDLVYLTRFPNLEYLSLYKTNISDAGLQHLRPLKALRRIHLMGIRGANGPRITDQGVAVLSELPELEQLDLPSIGNADKALEHISKLKKLKSLVMGGGWRDTGPFGDAGLAHLVGLSQLERLALNGVNLSDEGVDTLTQLTGLQSLTLSFGYEAGMTDDGVARLSELRDLRYLNLNASSGWVTRDGVSGLNGLNKLTELWFSWKRPSRDVPPLDLSGLPSLEKLGMFVRGQDLPDLAKCPNLKWLTIGRDPALTDDDLAALAGMPNLERLDITGDHITDKGLEHLAHLNRLSSLHVAANVTDAGLRHLEGLDALYLLRISSTNRLSPDALRRLRRSLPDFTHINVVDNRAPEGSVRALKVGQTAPAFDTESLDGTDLKLEDYRGKVLLLHFWSTTCGPCVASVPKLKQSYGILSQYDDFAMISLSGDDSHPALKKFINRHRFAWPQARIGGRSKIAADYGVRGYPKYVLIGRDGKILSHTQNKLDAALRKALEIEEDS